MTDTIYTMNLRHKGMTKYTHMPFTRIVRFKDKIVGIAPDGIYTISKDVTAANGVNIDSFVATGQMDFNSKTIIGTRQKRVPAVYVGYRSTGDILISLQDDAKTALAYTLRKNRTDKLVQRRIIAARNRRGRYWKVTWQNVDGCTFDIDNTELIVEVLKRRLST